MRVELVLDGPGEDLFLLREELLELDADKIEELATGPALPGTRGAAEIAGLVITVAESPVLGALLGLVQDWLARRRSGTITISIGNDRLELTAASNKLQREALRSFMARHSE